MGFLHQHLQTRSRVPLPRVPARMPPVNTPKHQAGFSRHMFNAGKRNRENKQLLGCGKGGVEGTTALF